MRKKIIIIFGLLFLISFGGCLQASRQIVNNIVNKEHLLGEISIFDLQTLVQETIEKVETSVIGIQFTERLNIFKEVTSIGSGVIVKRTPILINPGLGEDQPGNIKSYRYLVVTNRHVISSEKRIAQNPVVYLGFIDEEIAAQTLYYDERVDLALLAFESPVYLKPLHFASSETVRKGAFVIAIGNPSSFQYYASATFGIVSHPLRYLEDTNFQNSNIMIQNKYIQHDAAINAGNSGGGLFDIFGNLLGINTLKIIGKDNDIDNMGFSIPSSEIQLVLKDFL